MAQVTPLQFLGCVSVVAVPLGITAVYARPTFANAIKSKLDQERIEAQKKHYTKSDVYPVSLAEDELIKKYLATGDGKAREYKINY
ncbi:hypothetical protein CANARDRAFT_30128 [[Candida] arabinofermentans NRRL YB-2248]|uniref:Uncharacterized protein n=1 Tax=[Candida] arabinofermentans NRRL YB-2248 TaxID=983967 RepID=A0A1E4SVB5_9ASCO|nr:hypothetical protein CANARDRAFT_30128 [[Candida] arabinofermentans NRRL YB-2248]